MASRVGSEKVCTAVTDEFIIPAKFNSMHDVDEE